MNRQQKINNPLKKMGISVIDPSTQSYRLLTGTSAVHHLVNKQMQIRISSHVCENGYYPNEKKQVSEWMKKKPLYITGGECKLVQSLWKAVMEIQK